MPERLYTFEVWGQQLLDFIDEVVGEPTFLVSNSVGGVLLDPQKFRAALFHAPCQTSLLRRQVPHMLQTLSSCHIIIMRMIIPSLLE